MQISQFHLERSHCSIREKTASAVVLYCIRLGYTTRKTKLMKSNLLLLVAALILALSSSVVECEQNGVGEWQILTKQNYSSAIRLHPHILLIVTVPWSGESRSLTKELSNLVTERLDDFSSLKLMMVYRNNEKLLADAIGAAEGITVFYYRNSVSYKYQGKLRAWNILFSVHRYMYISPEEIPLTPLNSSEELKAFIESTDKALIMFEFCGWARKLLAKGNNNGTENGINLEGIGEDSYLLLVDYLFVDATDESLFVGNHFGLAFDREIDGTQISGEKDHEKGTNIGALKCGIENGFSGIPWFGQSSLFNNSDPLETENRTSGVGSSCKLEDFERFDSFFSKFVNVAREFFLPPERHRFGLVFDRSLLQHLQVEESDSWLAMLYLAGCPSCSKILKEENDLRSVLHMVNGVVSELDGDGQELDTILPANKSSILLFVDRSSNSSETRKNSKEALDHFRELALRYLVPHQIVWQKNDQSGTSIQPNQALRSISGHPRLKLSSAAQKFKDKMSIMVLDEGKHASLDSLTAELHGNSLHEILAYLLQKKKGAKLSSLAKEVGFHLLSDDFEIKIADASSPSQIETQAKQVSSTPSEEGLGTVNVDLDNERLLQGESISAVENPKTSDVSSYLDKEHTVFVKTKEPLAPKESDQYFPDHDLATSEDVKVEEKSSSQAYELGEPQLDFQGFGGSFFFCDGNYRLLRALTGGSTIPSLAIVDPISQQHYVSSEETIFSYSLMADFLHGFLNGSLLPFQLSESIPQNPKEATHPPFVNMDFHEVDSIPRVTVHTFSELVLGLNPSEDGNAFPAWNEDVVVLFSSSWCGFCQRMELVVREVYRALLGYMKMLKHGHKDGKDNLNGEDLKNAIFRLPQIYLMDCTLNDCSLILKSLTQREVYPVLMLFPAERKNALSYEGDVSVAHVIKFIADHGNNSHDLIGENGILKTLAGKGGRQQDLFEDSSPTTGNKEALVLKESFHEVILKSGTPKAAEKDNWIKSRTTEGLHKIAHSVVVGSVLIATDKLLGAHPFDNSKILIVKADVDIGFQGLIINKHIRWDSLHELEKGLEFLKQAPLSFGGPIIKHGMPFVTLTRRAVKNQYPEIIPDVFFLDQSATVNEIKELKSSKRNHSMAEEYWFFLGYSSWGWHQLFDEIGEGAWTIAEADDNNNIRMGHLDWPHSNSY